MGELIERRRFLAGAATVAGAAALGVGAGAAPAAARTRGAGHFALGVARYFDGSRRGYLRCELTSREWRTDARTVTTIASRVAPVDTTASYVVEAGRPGPMPA
jgi:phosphodiesterase/alkaline phosphatase D-like protein